MKTSKLDRERPLLAFCGLRQGTKTYAIECVRRKRHGKRIGRARLARFRSTDGLLFWFVDHGGKRR